MFVNCSHGHWSIYPVIVLLSVSKRDFISAAVIPATMDCSVASAEIPWVSPVGILGTRIGVEHHRLDRPGANAMGGLGVPGSRMEITT